MKIAIMYGHVASNIGDIAINKGQINLLRQVYPDAHFQVVYLDSSKSEFLHMANSSFDNDGSISFSHFTYYSEMAFSYLYNPEQFLQDTGIADADLIVLSSGEHLFHYTNVDNDKSFVCRTLPALAAKTAGKKCIIMPSTFGPFEDTITSDFVANLLNIVDGFASRESASHRLLKSIKGIPDSQTLLDPAFFLESGIKKSSYPSNQITDKGTTLGLIMRSETWGIRVSRTQQQQTDSLKSKYSNSNAYQFSQKICTEHLKDKNNKLVIFVQTVADNDLSQQIMEELSTLGFSDQIEIFRPTSIQNYFEKLNSINHIVSSRFHALILGLVLEKPVYGVYFDSHGHKIPGLFDLLKGSEHCFNLSVLNYETVSKNILDLMNDKNDTHVIMLNEIKRLKGLTVAWLQKQNQNSINIDQLKSTFKTFGTFSKKIILEGLRSSIKKQLDAVKTNAEETQKELSKNIQKLEIALVKEKENSRKIIALENELTQARLETQNTIQLSSQKITDLKSKLDKAHLESQNNIQLSSKKITDLQSELEKAQRTYKDNIQISTHQIAKLEAQLVSINSIEQELRKELTNLKNKLFTSEKELSNLKNKLTVSEAEKIEEKNKLFIAQVISDIKIESLEQKLDQIQLRFFSLLRNLLKASLKSPSAFLGLPRAIWRLNKQIKQKSIPTEVPNNSEIKKLLEVYHAVGLSGFEQVLSIFELTNVQSANAYTKLGRELLKSNPKDAAFAAEKAYKIDPKPFRAKWYAFRLYSCGELSKAAKILRELPSGMDLSFSEQDKIDEIFAKERVQNANKPSSVQNKSNNSDLDNLILAYKNGGYEALVTIFNSKYKDKRKISTSLIQTGKVLIEKGFPEAEINLAKAAVDIDGSISSLRGLFWAAKRAMDFETVCNVVERMENLLSSTSNEAELKKLAQLKDSPAYQISILKLIQEPQKMMFTPVKNRICYILHNSLPYASGGYATRAHGVAEGLTSQGHEVIVLTRPGYPLDNSSLQPEEINEIDVINSIKYVRLLYPRGSYKFSFDYAIQSSDVLLEQFKKYRPNYVIAASNHRVALPALIACRKLGIPFIYEVRGFWEVTRISREPEYGDTVSYRVQTILETESAKKADYVFTLTSAMKEKLVMQGVPSDNIELLPNSCDPSRFIPINKDEELAKKLNIPLTTAVIGYIGTFVDYEGLEDLAASCALLKAQGTEFRLMLVGSEKVSDSERGPIAQEILRIANEGNFIDWLIMPGRVPHEEVEQYYSLVDIAAFPRKPWPVCEMVSPMKPLEALAMEKAVVVSSVRALVDMIQHEQTGLVFEKGNVSALADTLTRLIQDPKLRNYMGVQGRIWVEQNRTWNNIGKIASGILHSLDKNQDSNSEIIKGKYASALA